MRVRLCVRGERVTVVVVGGGGGVVAFASRCIAFAFAAPMSAGALRSFCR